MKTNIKAKMNEKTGREYAKSLENTRVLLMVKIYKWLKYMEIHGKTNIKANKKVIEKEKSERYSL